MNSQKNILVLGDSHVRVFKKGIWAKRTSAFNWKVVSVEGATLSGLENPNSKTQAAVHFKSALSENDANIIVLCMGEVDTGFVIWYRAERDGIEVHQTAQRAVDNYLRLIESAKSKAAVIVISTPLPTILDNSAQGAIAKARASIKATQQQRTDLTCWFNSQIKTWCQTHDVIYVDLDDLSKGENGLVSDTLRHLNPKNHHYNPKQYCRLLKKELFPAIRKLTRTQRSEVTITKGLK